MKRILHTGLCIVILLHNAFSLFSNSPQIEKLSEIYYSKKIDNDQKRDSIIKTFFKTTTPANQLLYAEELIKIAHSRDDYQWLYRAYYFKGNAYIFMADLDEAFECYLKSLDALKLGNIKEGVGDIYFGMANSFSVSNAPEKAIFYFNKALEEYSTNADTIYIGYSYLSLINEYHNLNKLDSVQYFISLANSILEVKYDPNIQAYLFGYKAMLLAKINSIDSSLNEFAKSEKLFSERGRVFDIIAFQNEMAKILLQKKDYNSALQFAHDCYKQAQGASLKKQICDAAKLLSNIYGQLGDFEKAYAYQTNYINYKDSISNEETVRKIADLHAEYELSQKQIEIDFLEKRRFASRVALISIIVIAIVLLSLAYLLYTNNKTIKKQSRKLQEQTLALKELNRTKDRMFAIISHDLRSPISSITGYFSFMKELIETQDTERLLDFADEMTKSLQNISYLLDNLLNWATNQRGEIPYNPEIFHVHYIFDQLAEVFSNASKAKGVSIVLNIEEHTQINADKNTFETIFRNLISNAIKYTNAGDKITVTCEELPDKLKISVADTGIGISEKKLPYIFDFDDSKSTWGTANEKGVGLGLRLAHEFTELNKGKIYVESETCVGTTFYIEFPKV